MSDQPQARPVAAWVYVAVFAGVAIAVGGIAWLLGAPRPAAVPGGPAVTPTATVSATSTVTTQTAEPTPTAPATDTAPVAADGVHIAFIKTVTKSGRDYVFVLDFAELLTGDDAYSQGARDGVEVDGDYYLRNVNKKLRTLRTAGNATYVTYTDVPTKKYTYKVSDFYKWRTSSKKPEDFEDLSTKAILYDQAQAAGDDAYAFFFTVNKGLITKMEYFWTP